MKTFVWNLVLALAWLPVTGNVSAGNFLLGFVVGYAALWISLGRPGRTSYFRKVARLVRFSAYFLGEMVSSTLRVAADVVTPTHHMRPAVVAVPLDVETDVEITLLASLVTLTPGSLALDVSSDRGILFVHVMYVRDVEDARRRIKEGFERRVLELMR